MFDVQECNTVFPGMTKDFFNNSDIRKEYFFNVMKAEKELFGNIFFLNEKVRTLSLKSGDLNKTNLLGMKAVKVAQDSLIDRIKTK